VTDPSVESAARLTPWVVMGDGWKFVVWARNESRAVEHAFEWLAFVERDDFVREDATVERLGTARESFWACIA
jgi:hypothetical protein